QARLQPSAVIIIVRTSSRPAVATLSEPMNVIAISRPKITSETRSMGSSTLARFFSPACCIPSPLPGLPRGAISLIAVVSALRPGPAGASPRWSRPPFDLVDDVARRDPAAEVARLLFETLGAQQIPHGGVGAG